MRKIPTLLVRDLDDPRHVTSEITPGCEWVLAGEGTPTRKWDGIATMHSAARQWWARREVKPGKTPPPMWFEVDHDQVTGRRVGWEPITQSSFARWHAEALGHRHWPPGTYELCGPKINRNPDQLPTHTLIPHGSVVLVELDGPRTLERIIEVVRLNGQRRGWEGVVWHHPDGRMAKLKARDLPTPGGN